MTKIFPRKKTSSYSSPNQSNENTNVKGFPLKILSLISKEKKTFFIFDKRKRKRKR